MYDPILFSVWFDRNLVFLTYIGINTDIYTTKKIG